LPHFDLRQSVEWDKKRQIAAAAVELIEDGEAILLDGGSTTYELAQVLVKRPLQVVTNSLPVATLLSTSESVELVLIGGTVHSRTGVSLGPYANEMLAELNVRRAVLSVAGINERGYYNSNLLLVETERAMMSAADEVIVVADSTKFGHTSLSRLCGLGEIDTLVTDDQIDSEWRDRLIGAGVNLVVASAIENKEAIGTV
jgi:DeoR/GlpR family transcriptional regulator of sugar metabolism